MNLFEHIKSVLAQNEKYCKDGKLFKNVIVEDALKVEQVLLSLLLSDDKAIQHFFTEVGKVLVFDKIKFQKFVSNKQFLPDSYTSFKNKIGLTANGEYLTEAKEVVLDFPYKDCILEGGQTKEDQKRQEVFWNKTLAPDEIDRLLEPKVLTNFKKFNKDGKHSVDDITLNDNLIIKGNNLIALHTLKKNYKNKVKLIYIDPPFNTGNDSFQYNDSFNHSTWLTFMNNRLEIAKELLSDDGLIFINVDDIEEAYLKVLCDNIFGMENFLNVISVKSSTPSGTKTAHKDKTIIKQKDLILAYRKSRTAKLNPQYTVREKWDKHYSLYLEKNKEGDFILSKLIDKLLALGVIKVKVGLDKLNINDKAFKQFYLKHSNSICRLQSHKNKEADKLSREKGKVVFEHFKDGESKGLYFNGQVITPLKQGIHKVYSNQKFVDDLGMLLCDFWWDIDYQNTQNEGGVSFPTAKKPEMLISRIIELCTNENDIVLDYHLGSGTTASVALKANRRFIGIEQLDYGADDSVQRLQNVINGDQSGVSKAYNWNGGGSFIYTELSKCNYNVIDQVNEAKDSTSLNNLWENLKNNSSINYNINLIKMAEHSNDFSLLDFDDKKKVLLELLDANQLYINYSDIEDLEHKIPQEEKAINIKFYDL